MSSYQLHNDDKLFLFHSVEKKDEDNDWWPPQPLDTPHILSVTLCLYLK